MRDTTKSAMQQCLKVFKDIEKGEFKEKGLSAFFKKLSNIDYRDEYETKVDFYIKTFATGAYRITETDPRTWTASNSRRNIEKPDVKYYCTKFLSEHFVHVQREFWKRYKNEMHIHKIWNRYRSPISPKFILDTCKKIKTEHQGIK